MFFNILLTIQIVVCLALGGLVLIQRSEGGALGVGGGPSGFMSARGAGNLLTRATSILAFCFFACAIAMTIVGNMDSRRNSILEGQDTTGLKQTAPATPAQQPVSPPASQSTTSAPSLSTLPGVSSSSAPVVAPAPISSLPASSAPASRAAAPRPSASASSSSRTASPSASTSSTTSPAQ